MSDFRVGSWIVRPSTNAVFQNGTSRRVEPKVMEVLVCLASQPAIVVPKKEIFRAVWPDTFVSDDTLVRAISELRRVLGDDPREPKFIETIPKRGYRLVASVTPVNGNNGNLKAQVTEQLKPNRRNFKFAWLMIAGLLLACAALLGFEVNHLRGHIFRGKPSIHSVAVLPLKNLSNDPLQKYFAEGMTEELITDLSQIGALKVISRTSSGLYEESHKALPEIAVELNADAIITGSVQRFGDRVRVIAQLTYAPRDQNIWAGTYERDLKDALGLQSEVAAAIAREIRTQVSPEEEARLHASRPVNVRALQAYLQGTYYINRKGRGSGDVANDEAAKYFREAIADDPSFAPSYIALANTYCALLHPSIQAHAAMKSAVEKALALDQNSSDAHTAFAQVMSDDWQWAAAEKEYRQALDLNPNNIEAHLGFGVFLQAMGRLPEAVPEFERAQELDPRGEHLSSILADQGKYDQAIALKRQAVVNDPENGYLHYELAGLLADAGYYEDWMKELQRALVLFGVTKPALPLESAFKRTGFRGAMQVWAGDLERAEAQGTIYMPLTLADVYAGLGDNDRAFFWLQDAFHHYRHGYSESADGGMKWLKGDHCLRPLHADARYTDLVRRVGLPQ